MTSNHGIQTNGDPSKKDASNDVEMLTIDNTKDKAQAGSARKERFRRKSIPEVKREAPKHESRRRNSISHGINATMVFWETV